MEQLQGTFYIVAIIYMSIGIAILLGIGVTVFIVIKMIMDLKKQVDHKMQQVQNIIDHPEDYAAQFSMSLLKAGLRSAKKIFKKNTDEE